VDAFATPPASLNWNDVKAWRVRARKTLIAGRLSLDRSLRLRRGADATQRLLRNGALKSYPILGVYWPVRGEIDVQELSLDHLGRGGRVALPVVVAKSAPVEFWNWRPGMPMNRGVWNIPVPATREVVELDALIVPLVGFDSKRYRLGYGGGYYDRTLAHARRRPFCIGLGYQMGRLDSIFPQPHDIPMDVIVADADP
jgi:5-formyltetrahydrofolate cyclo-ligase